MGKKIVILTGSFRTNGNTAKLAEAFAKGATEAGHEVQTLNAARMNINGCMDCKYCHSHEGVCVQKDDMQQVHTAVRSADVVVMASPVYYYSISGQLKTAIDRMFVAKGKAFDNVKKAYLLLTYASGTGEMIEPCVQTVKYGLGCFGWDIAGVVEAQGVYGVGEIEGNAALTQAEEMGRSV